MEKLRKTDRRTLYTRSLIKDIFLDLLRKKDFHKITVSEICKLADINRGTFYLHYLDIDDVLDDVFQDFLSETSSVVEHILCPMKDTCHYPFCQKIQTETHYHPLFFDSTTSIRFLNKIMESGKESFITYLMQNSHLTFEQAEALFHFQMNGCLAINQMMLKNHCSDWTQIQKCVDSFIKAGLENFLQKEKD